METTIPTTYADAHTIEGGAYRLARLWVDKPARDGSSEWELGELAVVSALTDRLKRWLPISIQSAAVKGATFEQIMAATGHTEVLLREVWRNWATGQRHLYDKLREDPAIARSIGLSVEDYNKAAAVLGCPQWS